LQLLSWIIKIFYVLNVYMMKKKLIKILLPVLVFGIFASCSKLNEPVPLTPELTIHREGILDKDSPTWHGNLVRESSWDLKACQNCHAADYSGGITGASCLNCHRQPEGPEACNTCHGDFTDPAFIAPPQDTNNNISTDSTGVGAHVSHLYQNDLGSQIPCTTCHVVPQDYFDPGHAVDDPLPAEVIFSPLAIHNIAVNPVYDHPSATCSDTYCHGNWEFLKDSAGTNAWIYTDSLMVGKAFSPIWNKVDGTQASCGTCHMLPPEGHQNAGNDPDALTCSGCHTGIVDPNGNIIDTDKHINGEKNVFGN
jgi:hypothetical protein